MRREIFLQRFASFLVNKNVDGTIQAFSKRLPSLLSEFGAASGLNLTEQRIVTRAVNAEMSKLWTSMWGEVTDQMDKMAILDAKHVTTIFDDILGVTLKLPSDSAILGQIANSNMILTSGSRVQAQVWSKYLRDNISTALKSVNGAIWSGYTSGSTNAEIVANLRGIFNRATGEFQGGLLQGLTRNQAEALVRTGVSHFSNESRDRVYASNKDIIQSRVLFATLDNRTTDICLGRHLQEWDIDDNSYPRLPFHFNERSVYVVRLKGDPPLTETVESADEFLRSQPKSFIEDTLGKKKADLFINEKFSVKRFTDMTGRSLTLEELGS